MNPFAIAGGAIDVFSLPLRRPFVTALGAKTSTQNARLLLRLRGGGSGYGEASSSIVLRRHTPAMLAAALRRLLARFMGQDARRLAPLARAAWDSTPLPAAAAAFECALTEALAAQLGVSPRQWHGGACSRIETDITISAVSPEEAARAAGEAAREGFRSFKVKVGAGAGDLDRVLAVDEAARRPRLILDGNQRMSLRSALALAEACLKRGLRLELLEQPLPAASLAAMAALTRRSPVPVAADESARTVAEVLRVLELGAADVINVKVAKTGLSGSLDVIALARAAGKRLMIGCMQESARGLSASVHLALGTGAFDFADLDSDRLLAEPQPAGTFRRDGPVLSA